MKTNNPKRIALMVAQALSIGIGSTALVFNSFAQQAAPVITPKAEKIEVTGSLIKRTDTETPSLVQVITADEIMNSGFATVEDLLRSVSAFDATSVQDGAASGFVGGLATISLRGFGSQGTLILINGRRIAPVAAVDVNFGRGSLLSVNTIPREAIERIEILKDGASALYGSDAMAGVINYILKKDYRGIEANASYGANTEGVGKTTNASLTFGFGDLASQRFNVFGGITMFRRDPVMHSELKDRGNLESHNAYLGVNGSLLRFTPDSVASPFGSYYRVPASTAGSTIINGISVANNSVFGTNYLGTFPGCPAALTVGQGVPTRLPSFTATTASFREGQCRYNLDEADEAISKQERISGSARANFAISNELTAYADIMFARTTTTEFAVPRVVTTGLVSTALPNAVTWPLLTGTFLAHGGLVLPVGHPDNPTRGTATPIPVQVIHRFADLPSNDINELKIVRVTTGLQGSIGAWDIDTALLYSRQENSRVQQMRLRKSLIDASLAAGTYRFTGTNTDAAKASVASDAVNEGEATVAAFDVRGSRELFTMAGGKAAIAIGAEARRETLSSVPSDIYKTGDFIGLVANGAEGARNSQAVFAEIRLPVAKTLELQGALRQEKYSDFGNSSTGKVGFKWDAAKEVSLRGTATTGFRAPSISQIGDSFLLSFHSSQDRRVFDNLRCNLTNPALPVSRANPAVNRDCNMLNFSAVPAGTVTPGNMPTVISANRNLKPETSKSFTLGTIIAPTKDLDLALDGWFFRRNDEIRVQRGIDIMDAFNADPVANAAAIIRDPNPATWLPGIPNSGPILIIKRDYGNFLYTKTAGFDYDMNYRFPSSSFGKFSININGTVTRYFRQQILASSPEQNLVGYSASDVPKHKGSATLRWKKDNFAAWVRFNHISALHRGAATDTCMTSTAAGPTYIRANGSCFVDAGREFDMGGSYTGIKNLTVSLTMLNVENSYTRAIDIPSTFNWWDNGTSGQLGRRFNLNLGYKFK